MQSIHCHVDPPGYDIEYGKLDGRSLGQDGRDPSRSYVKLSELGDYYNGRTTRMADRFPLCPLIFSEAYKLILSVLPDGGK